MTSLWKGPIALPDGLPQPSLESIEFISSTPDAANGYNPKPEPDGTIFNCAELKVQAVVEASKVPLWLSCGPSFDVQTENEGTAGFLMNVFVRQSDNQKPSSDLEGREENEEDAEEGNNKEDEGDESSEVIRYESTNKALVVRVSYETAPEETEKPIITELVLYGTLSSDPSPYDGPTDNAESETTSAQPSLSVYALPLSSRLIKEKKLHTSVKSEALEPNKAKFLAPIIGRKRKFHAVFTEYDRKQAYYATLPPGLRRSWHQRSNSLASLKDELNENSASGANGGDSQKSGLFSRSVGPGAAASQPITDFRKTINEDPRYKRERSTSVFQARLREAAERPDPPSRRESSLKPLRNSVDFTAMRRSETFAGLRTRNQTPETKQDFAASTITNTNNGANLGAPTTNKFAERNKTSAQKLILASMRLYGFTRAKAGEAKVESEEEEYKLVFHTTLRSLTCAMRKSWSSEIISITRLKETTEYLMKAFVGGSGVVQGSSDREEEAGDLKHREEENPFRKSTIGRRSLVLSGTTSRDDTLVGEDSLLGNSFLGESLLGGGLVSDD
ncbi:hypothetical protein TWF481_000489 [Arthrobotrys musiformis]|uniref:Sld7 C-terminal domain-containing protein n=1 Tax=Arthrobotrys musiformis TaxID=47236 RepID=A0AAV9WPJ3_9PEZI